VKYAYQEWPHPVDSLPTQPTRREEKRTWHGNTMINFKTDATNNENKNPRVTALKLSVANQFVTGGLNEVLGCTLSD
jgi:hypothetical protein